MLLPLASASFGQSPYHYRDRGLAVGALMGALTGGAIGKNNGNTLAGAAIGTAVGALTGAAVGDSIDTDMAWRDAARRQQYARQAVRAVTVQDVISMSQAGLSDDVIATHIRNNGVARRPQPEDLIAMSQSGVSNTVIRAMETAPLATPRRAPAPPPYRNGVIVEEHYYHAPAPVWYYPAPCAPPRVQVHEHYVRPGFHWGISFGH